MIKIIAALGRDGQLGRDNQLLWHLPDDFKFFKQTTMGQVLLMGRKTFESIGRALPGRITLVVSRQKDLVLPSGVLHAWDLDEAYSLAQKQHTRDIFICGGGEIYRQCLPLCEELLLTRVDYTGLADTYFPTWDEAQWVRKEQDAHPQDERHQYAFVIERWQRS